MKGVSRYRGSYHWLGAMALITSASLLAAACGNDDDDEPASPAKEPAAFECDSAEKDGWETCQDDKVLWCHGESHAGGTEGAHFHTGVDCAADGKTCVVIDADEHLAGCLDGGSSCTTGESKCEGNAALVCVGGKWASRNCGTAATCELEGGHAHCHGKECGGHGHLHEGTCHCDPGFIVDPTDATLCISEKPFPEMVCETYVGATPEAVTATADPEAAHLHLGERLRVTLDGATATKAHFDAEKPGSYVVFLSVAGVLQGATVEGASITDATSKAGANPNCSSELVEHWHLTVAAAGEVQLDFAPASTVDLIVLHKPE